jgi:ribosomal protein S18 acetylase RimI-like enzyme
MMIRKASKTDTEGCYSLVQSDGDSYWRLEDLVQSTTNEDAIFLVAEEGGGIIGYIQGYILPTKRTEAMIHETRVKVQRRGHGIGVELVCAFCEEAFNRGVEVVLAEIEVGKKKE